MYISNTQTSQLLSKTLTILRLPVLSPLLFLGPIRSSPTVLHFHSSPIPAPRKVRSQSPIVGAADPGAWLLDFMISCAFVYSSVFKKILRQGKLLQG